MTATRDRCYLGIDVGTGSARAGLFDGDGRMLAAADHPIQIWREGADFVEQSSADIWHACGIATRGALAEAGVSPDRVRGIGFDATCSLVALDKADRPVTVSPSGDDQRNVIVWMDHRALEQAERIGRTGHAVLRHVGGVMSPEMESPKLLWLRENLPETWRRAARFFDLPDLLVYLATGTDVRSLCTTVCKWTYLGHETAPAGYGGGSGHGGATGTGSGPGEGDTVGRWDDSFFRQIGLGDLVDEGYRRVGRRIQPMGQPAGSGLSARAAAELGLTAGTAVGVAIIDAHAGGLGVLGARLDDRPVDAAALLTRLALIGGTSSCHMAVSRQARFIPGVWGPYFSAMVPGLWLNEGGQSATGSLIDHVVFGHARSEELRQEARAKGTTAYQLLNERLDQLAATRAAPFPAALTRDLHVLPYFHGNRSPRADPTLRGAIAGLRLSDSIDDLALLYLATVQAIAYGTRHIVEAIDAGSRAAATATVLGGRPDEMPTPTPTRRGTAALAGGGGGQRIADLFACGGGTKNRVFVREHADATGCRVVLPREPEAVLLGSAVLGAVAAGDHPSVVDAMGAMNAAGATVEATRGETARYHDAKYAVFHRMHDDLLAYRRAMQ
ncbi:MAG TPA: FGGY-family carbohydrate kinase [Kofleriaceae bacterium]|nr:FGGY-family carbohydrate kinase [Kofleriaceae bacterium]